MYPVMTEKLICHLWRAWVDTAAFLTNCYQLITSCLCQQNHVPHLVSFYGLNMIVNSFTLLKVVATMLILEVQQDEQNGIPLHDSTVTLLLLQLIKIQFLVQLAKGHHQYLPNECNLMVTHDYLSLFFYIKAGSVSTILLLNRSRHGLDNTFIMVAKADSYQVLALL